LRFESGGLFGIPPFKSIGYHLAASIAALGYFSLGTAAVRSQQGGHGTSFDPGKNSILPLSIWIRGCRRIAQHQVGALKNLEAYGAARRLGQACYGLLFYVWKTLLPINLSPLYETPMQLSTSDELSFVIAGAIVCAVSVFLLREKRLKPLLAGWIYYGLLLLPVLGIAQSGPQLVADRYSYLACLSWAILGAAGFFYLWRNFRAARTIIGASATSLLVLLSALTWRQIGVWHDSTALWTRAVQIYPEGARSLTNYGAALMRNGEVEKAMEQYRKALRIVPFYSVAHNNLASALLSRGKYDLAIGEYREAIRLNPNFSQAYYNLGVTLVLAGQPKEAVLQ